MKLTIESTSEFVDVTAGKARVWKGFTESGEQCLLFVRCLHSPELDRIQEFDDLNSPITCGVSSAELDRIGALVFQGDPRSLGASEYSGAGTEAEPRIVAELKAIRDDPTLDPALRAEAMELLRIGAAATAEIQTREFWRRVLELRRKRDERPPR